MRALAVFFLAVSVSLVLCYDEKFDKIDVDKIIENDALFSEYNACMLDKGPCDNVQYADEFKKHFPELVATACAKCTPIQKQHIRKSVKALSERRPDDFIEFRKKYDPNGEYEAKFSEFVLSEA